MQHFNIPFVFLFSYKNFSIIGFILLCLGLIFIIIIKWKKFQISKNGAINLITTLEKKDIQIKEYFNKVSSETNKKNNKEYLYNENNKTEIDTNSADFIHLKSIVEAIFFIDPKPLTYSYFKKKIGLDYKKFKIIIKELENDYSEHGIQLRDTGTGYQFVAVESIFHEIKNILHFSDFERLTKIQLETLAIVAYKQPITRPEIDEIRGSTTSSETIKKLMERNLIRITGRKETPGRPLQYGTTDEFLKYFGLKNLNNLPKLKDPKTQPFIE